MTAQGWKSMGGKTPAMSKAENVNFLGPSLSQFAKQQAPTDTEADRLSRKCQMVPEALLLCSQKCRYSGSGILGMYWSSEAAQARSNRILTKWMNLIL